MRVELERMSLEQKRNHLLNCERGEAVNRIKTSTDWAYIEQIKTDLIDDLKEALFIGARPGVDLVLEPTYNQIISFRHGVISGVNKFFDLLKKLEDVYSESRKKETEIKDV